MKQGQRIASLRQGFTLLELSVVIVIVALLVGSTIVLGTVRIDQEKVNATKARIAMVEKALAAYAELNKRLPCPSYPTYKPNETKYGKESSNPGSCKDDTPGLVWLTPTTAIGSIPFKTLGLPEDSMYDGWGRRITYSVYIPMTQNNVLKNNTRTSSCGGITIQDDNGTNEVTNALYVLVSHGVDGHGAFLKNGTQLNANITHNSSLINAHVDSAFAPAPTAIFRTLTYFDDPADKKNRFDDILIYKARKDMALQSDRQNEGYNVNNNNAPPGWLYVPQSTLPDGTVVPGFEVMKYEAKDPNGVGGDDLPNVGGRGFPRSQAAGVPWNNISWSKARQACQMMGGDTNTSGYGPQRGYDIISERQWLSLVNQLTDNSLNWKNGCYGDGELSSGMTDGVPSSAQAASVDDSQAYINTGNVATSTVDAEVAQKRTMTLPSGSAVWDIGGNVQEYTICNLSEKQCPTFAGGQTRLQYYTNSQKAAAGNYTFESFTKDGVVDNFIPPNPSNWADLHAKGYGIFKAGTPSASPIDVIRRGGIVNGRGGAGYYGVYTTELAAGSTAADTGFRCARTIDPPVISPISLSGLQVWYDASDLDADGIEQELDDNVATRETGITTATCTKPAADKGDGCVGTWKNKAQLHLGLAPNYNAVMSNDNNKPTLRLNAINGRPAVHFAGVKSGTAQTLDTYQGAGTGYPMHNLSKFTIFIVAKGARLGGMISANDDNTQATAEALVLFPYNAADDGNPPSYVFLTNHLLGGTDVTNLATRDYCKWTATGGGGCAGGTIYSGCARFGNDNQEIMTVGDMHIFAGVYNPGINNGLAAFIDGGAGHPTNSAVQITAGKILPAAKNCGGNPVEAYLRLGSQRAYESGTNANGDLAEVIIYDRALSAGERLLVEKYLSQKYNIPLKGVQ